MRRTVLIAAVAGLVGALVATPVVVYASHRFTDVPDGHVFHNAIDWMADEGITVGCNPPDNDRYCPEDNVTRGQMAAFMKRLAENQVVDAGTLNGYQAAELAPRAAFNSTTDAPDGDDLTLSTTITAPAPGLLIISGGVDVRNDSTANNYRCEVRLDGGLIHGTQMFSQLDGDVIHNVEEDCTTTGAEPVAAGDHTIDFNVDFVDPSTDLTDAMVWVIWVPFDGEGDTP